MVTHSLCLPCFTKSGTPRLWHNKLGRWMTAREKLAASGLPVSKGQTQVSGVAGPRWQEDNLWRARVGNGQQLQCIGLVWVCTLASLRIRPEVKEKILFIDPPSQPAGLSVQKGKYFLQVGDEKFEHANEESAMAAHKKVHVPCPKLEK